MQTLEQELEHEQKREVINSFLTKDRAAVAKIVHDAILAAPNLDLKTKAEVIRVVVKAERHARKMLER